MTLRLSLSTPPHTPETARSLPPSFPPLPPLTISLRPPSSSHSTRPTVLSLCLVDTHTQICMLCWRIMTCACVCEPRREHWKHHGDSIVAITMRHTLLIRYRMPLIRYSYATACATEDEPLRLRSSHLHSACYSYDTHTLPHATHTLRIRYRMHCSG